MQLTAEHDYFFYLYLAYVGCQIILAGLALFHHPGEQHLQLLDLPDQIEYSVSAALHTSNLSISVCVTCLCPHIRSPCFSGFEVSHLICTQLIVERICPAMRSSLFRLGLPGKLVCGQCWCVGKLTNKFPAIAGFGKSRRAFRR